MMRLVTSSIVCVGLLTALPASPAGLTRAQMQKLLSDIDTKFRFPKDFVRSAYIEQKFRDEPSRVFQTVVYRRDRDRRLTLLITKPKTWAGVGILRTDKNLWSYSPNLGQWTRMLRSRVVLTSVQTHDFDDWHLGEWYDPTYVGEEKIGKIAVHHIELRAKKDADEAPDPSYDIWIDKRSQNPIKMVAYTAAGRKLRTNYWLKYGKKTIEGKDYVYWTELKVLDEVTKGNGATILLHKIEVGEAPDEVFTKAWIESKSR